MSDLSIWEKESFYATQDIIIVGGGLMGLWTALELKRKNAKLHVTILERTPIPFGASTRNAGFACFGSPTEMIHDAEQMGTDSLLEIVEMRFRGIEKIKSNFSNHIIDYDPCGGYECINKNYPYWDDLDGKLDWLNGQLKDITKQSQTFVRKDHAMPLQKMACAVLMVW